MRTDAAKIVGQLCLKWSCCFAALTLTCSPLVSARAAEFEWQTATPESQGLSAARLDELRRGIEKMTKALFVVRSDKVVYEWYAPDHSANRPHYTASMAKAVVGGLSTALAIDDGKLALDDPASKFIPEWRTDPRKAKITIRHLGSHTSGLEDSSVPGIAHPNEPGWKGEFWKRNEVPADAFTISRDQTPLLFDPGTDWAYSNPGIAMLTYATTAAIQDGPHKDVRTLLRERILRPIGVPDNEWSIGYGKTYVVNGLPLVGSWGGGSYTARAAARVGRLLLRGGDWDGRRILSQRAVSEVTSDAGTPGVNGIGWWSNNSGRHPKLPRDAFWGAGAGHQILLVVPSLNLVVVRNGGNLPGEYDDAVGQHLFDPLMAAVMASGPDRSAAPYPPSRHIARIEWAPQETIVRKARGGDNWPITWADDGHLYTAYGDANGFEPFVPQKLSMGLARVAGSASDFSGFNLRSPTFETKGDGARGRKASGMLMVEGVLYALVRNADNAQLGWSSDHGQTWTWADWKFTTSFGCPTFLNFGPNYTSARDEYVYIYSLDHDSAYEAADQMVLARVPKSRLTDRAAYEFFQRLDNTGNPIWTKDVAERGAVFSHRGSCYRSGITYNAALKRYLWCQVLPKSTHAQGPRFQGGFGVYDAPEPWGPWTTAFFTAAWDVGPGETNSFPTKWMSADGQVLHLVFSGDDHFSVREARLVLTNDNR